VRWRGSSSFDEDLSDDLLGGGGVFVPPGAGAGAGVRVGAGVRLRLVPGHPPTALLRGSIL